MVEESTVVTLGNIVPFLKRSVWIAAASMLISVSAGLAYVLTEAPGFVANTQLMIEPQKQLFMWRDTGMLDLTFDNAELENQVEILKSEKVAGNVVDRLDLVNVPEFQKPGASTDYERRRIAIGYLRNGLSARRVGQSYILDISFVSRNPETAAKVANAIAEAYLRDQIEAKADIARQASRWFEERVAELGDQLNAASRAVQRFKTENGIVGSASSNGQVLLLDKLTELEARAQSYLKLYESFVQKLTENQQQESFPVANARVITAATMPLGKAYPKTKLVLALAVLIGALGGFGIAFVRHVLDHSLRTANQVRQWLRLPCLGWLPDCRSPRWVPGLSPQQQALDAPFSAFTSALRGIKVALDTNATGSSRTIGLVSLRPGEGASTLCTNLGALFALSGSKTLLIDADFRERTLSRRAAPNARVGLRDLLHGGDSEAIIADPYSKAHLLPVVDSEQIANSADMLGSSAMRNLLERLSSSYEVILVDLPGLNRGVDARAIGPALDGCILVVEWGRTKLEALREAVSLLQAGRVALLGVVINKVEEGFPPLFGITLDSVRLLGWGRHLDRLKPQLVSR
ncbi:MAG: hypothetical protein JO305_10975 [Alphaproteobacteria bacterium]|nr:hypothetical protein [Alphaproteobacteria bacterium]